MKKIFSISIKNLYSRNSKIKFLVSILFLGIFVSVFWVDSVPLPVSAATAVLLPDMNKIDKIAGDLEYDDGCDIDGTSDFRAALNLAQPGDTICLKPGSTTTGRFLLPAKTNSNPPKYITIRTGDLNNPNAVKVAGCTLGATCLEPKIRVDPSRDQAKLAKIVTNANFAIELADGASYYRFIGLDIGSSGGATSIVQLGDPCIAAVNHPFCIPPNADVSKIPHHIIIDRSYIHGPHSSNVVSGVAVNANYVGIANSHIDEVHVNGNGDTQAISIYNSLGPVLVQNNFLESAGENILVGGGLSGLLSTNDISLANTKDIVIRGNHFWKDPSRRNNDPVYDAKNLLELKWGVRVLIEGNIFENHWEGVQSQHYAIVFKTTSQKANGQGKYVQTKDVTFRYNIIKDVDNAIQVGRYNDVCDYNKAYATDGTRDIRINDNLIIGLGAFNSAIGDQVAYAPDGLPRAQEGETEAVGAANQIFEHNTIAKPLVNNANYLYKGQNFYRPFKLSTCKPDNSSGDRTNLNLPIKIPDLTFRNNVVAYQASVPQAGIPGYLPNYILKGNVIIGPEPIFPNDNKIIPGGYSGIVGTDGKLLIDYNGTDGIKAGANITLLQDCTGGVETGRWNGCNVPDPQDISVSISASPNPIILPASQTTLTWTTSTSTAPTSCVGSGAWSEPNLNPTGGSKVVTGLTAGSHTFIITCSKSGLPDATNQVRVLVNTTGGGGDDDGGSCDANFNGGTSVTLSAIPDLGSTFAGWSGACTNTTGDCVVSMTEAKNVNAIFNLSGGGGGGGRDGSCVNPATMPSGYAAPCPVLELSSYTPPSGGQLTVWSTFQNSYEYFYISKRFYISESVNACPGGESKVDGLWCPFDFSGTAVAGDEEYVTSGRYQLNTSQLSQFSNGTHYVVSWDWTWNGTCFVGPGSNVCDTGKWRLQSFVKSED